MGPVCRNFDGKEIKLLKLYFWILRDLTFPYDLKKQGCEGVEFPIFKEEYIHLFSKFIGLNYIKIKIDKENQNFDFIKNLKNVSEIYLNIGSSNHNIIDFNNINANWNALTIDGGVPRNIQDLDLPKLFVSTKKNLKFELPKRINEVHLSLGTKDLVKFPESSSVEALRLLDSKITSLNGIEKYPNLKFIKLHSTFNLEDIDALQNLKHLKEIDIKDCLKLRKEKLSKYAAAGIVVREDGAEIKNLKENQELDLPKEFHVYNGLSGQTDFGATEFLEKNKDSIMESFNAQIGRNQEWTSKLKEYLSWHHDYMPDDTLKELSKLEDNRLLETLSINQVIFIQSEGSIQIWFDYIMSPFEDYKYSIRSTIEGDIISVELES